MHKAEIAKIEAALKKTCAASSDFDLNPDVEMPEGRVLRQAAVLVPIQQSGTGLRVVLTKRASHLKHHPGQISFPGGKREDADVDLIATALREAHEEIGLPHSSTRIIGQLAPHETVTSFSVTPVVAEVSSFDAVPEIGEVAEVFTVPLEHLLMPENFAIEGRFWRGTKRFYYTVPYGPYYIWGATARILRSLATQVTQ